MPNFVQEYRSTDVGMPTLSGTTGNLIALLDVLLLNGGTTQTVTSMSESGTTVTAVIPADTTLESFDWLVIAGASPSGANGTVQITVTDSTHFTYQAAAGLGTITGSITYKRAALGWTKPFTGTNIAVYLPQSGLGFPQHYLRVEDNGLTTGGAKEAVISGWEVMTDATGTSGKFPTAAQIAISGTASQAGGCLRKSSTSDSTTHSWYAIGDGATFYFIPNSDNVTSQGRGLYSFGGFISFKAGDAYNSLISLSPTFNTGNVGSNSLNYCYTPASIAAGGGLFLARALSQAGGSLSIGQMCRSYTNTSVIGAASSTQTTYPNPADSALWVDSTMLMDSATSPRGRPRGLYTHIHGTVPFGSEFDTVTNVAGLSGVTLIHVIVSSNGSVLFDKFGPW